MSKTMKIFTGTSNRALAERICEHIGVGLGDGIVDRFADGEIRVKLNEDVRGPCCRQRPSRCSRRA